jgi:hypothetical protein
MKFTEARLEQAILDLLKEEGYPHHIGETISRGQSEVLIKEDLSSYLSNKYSNENITQSEIVSVLCKLETFPALNLYIPQFNLQFYSSSPQVAWARRKLASDQPFGRGWVRDHEKWKHTSLAFLPGGVTHG